MASEPIQAWQLLLSLPTLQAKGAPKVFVEMTEWRHAFDHSNMVPCEVTRALSDYLGVKVPTCVEGTSVREDQFILSSGIHVVVSTPDRVWRKQSLRLDYIFQLLPTKVHAGVFSSAMLSEALEITRKFMNKPVGILVKQAFILSTIQCLHGCWKSRLHFTYKQFEMDEERLANTPDDISPEGWAKLIEHFSSKSFQKMSKINLENRAKLLTKHTCGNKSFAEIEESTGSGDWEEGTT